MGWEGAADGADAGAEEGAVSTDAGAGEETGLGAEATDAGATDGAVTTDTDEGAGSTGTGLGPIQDVGMAGAAAGERAGAGAEGG